MASTLSASMASPSSAMLQWLRSSSVAPVRPSRRRSWPSLRHRVASVPCAWRLGVAHRARQRFLRGHSIGLRHSVLGVGDSIMRLAHSMLPQRLSVRFPFRLRHRTPFVGIEDELLWPRSRRLRSVAGGWALLFPISVLCLSGTTAVRRPSSLAHRRNPVR